MLVLEREVHALLDLPGGFAVENQHVTFLVLLGHDHWRRVALKPHRELLVEPPLSLLELERCQVFLVFLVVVLGQSIVPAGSRI